MKIQKIFLTPNKYSRPQIPLKKVTKIAVHYVGGAGAKAINVRNYFESLKDGSRYASSHYIVGLEGEVIQCIPENEISYCTNEANSYSISIENCHPKADGKFNPETEASLVELCADLCKRYKLNPQTDIIRHYDVTGKYCPLYWVTHPIEFMRFKNKVETYMKNGGIDMEELKKLTGEVKELTERVKDLEDSREKIFMTIDDIPQWGKPTIEKLMANKAIEGDGQYLDISYSFLRMLVVMDRMGAFNK